jgi:hypothetical protein
VLALLSITLIGILVVANAFALDVALGEFDLAWVAVMSGIEVASVAGALLLWPRLRPAVRWHWLEILGMLAVGGVFLAHAIYLAPADGMPVSFSVDCSHQHLLVNYIYQHDSFPDNVAYLYIYDDYPVGPSTLAAFLAHLLGVLPAQTMYPLAALLVAAQVMLAYGIGLELLPRSPGSHLWAAGAAFMVFLVYSYSVQVFAGNFYSNMILSDLIVLLALWTTVVREWLHPLVVAGVTLGLAFGCLNSYPAWLPFVVFPLVASMVIDRRMSIRRRVALVGVVVVVTAILAAIAVVDQWSFITWFAPTRARQLMPGLESLGGVLLVFIACGVWVWLRSWRRLLGFTLFLVIDAALVFALYGAAILDKLTLYIPDKTFYFNVFIFLVLVALGLDWAWRRWGPAGKPKGWMAAVALILVALMVGVGTDLWFPRPADYPITLDEYRVAYRVSQEMPDAEFTYLVRTAATFYWIYGCTLNHTHDLTEQFERWQAHVPTYEGWMQDSAAPRRAIVSDLTTLPQDGRWRPLIRSGKSGMIEKAP